MTERNFGVEVIAAPYPIGFGVGPFYSSSASEAEKEIANAEAGKAALVLRRPSKGLVELLRHLAESAPGRHYVVSSAGWLETMLKATKGLNEDDMKRLHTFDWSERNTPPEELRRELRATLKTK